MFLKRRKSSSNKNIGSNKVYVKSLLDSIKKHQSDDGSYIIEKILSDVVYQLQTAADDGVKIERILSLEPIENGFLVNKFGIKFEKEGLKSCVMIFDIPDKSINENACNKIIVNKLANVETAKCLQKFFNNIDKKYEQMINGPHQAYPLDNFQPAGY